MSMNIRARVAEVCSCGASITIDYEWLSNVKKLLPEWRENHLHTPPPARISTRAMEDSEEVYADSVQG
jgi:hypothetical protein